MLDADDAWLPKRMEHLTTVGNSMGADFVADNVIKWDLVADREISVALDLPKPAQEISVVDFYENDHNFNFSNFSYALLKPILRRSFLEHKVIKYFENMRTGEDFVFYAEILLNNAKAILISNAYYLYSVPYTQNGKSPHTRSNYNFLEMVQASDALQERYKDQLDKRLEVSIAKRRNTVLQVHQANVARGYRGSKQLVRYFLYVGRKKPALVGSLFSRMLHEVPDTACSPRPGIRSTMSRDTLAPV